MNSPGATVVTALNSAIGVPKTSMAPFYIGITILVIILIMLIVIVTMKSKIVATPSTVAVTVASRVAALNALIEPTAGSQKSLAIVGKNLPQNQQVLINYAPTSCRLAGYLGPLQDGVFAEEDAVRLAYGAGCRLFVVEISKDTSLGSEGNTIPLLVARDSAGYKRSLNDGSLAKLFTAFANSPQRQQASDDPLILFLYFHDHPSDPADNLAYMSRVAVALRPLIPFHLGLTDMGDFTRQKMAASLFTFSPDTYKGKVLILTNAETNGFRDPGSLGVNRTFSPNEDLDFFIHSRVMSLTSMFGSVTPSSAQPTAILADDTYFTNTPSTNLTTLVNMTRNTFTIVMRPDPSWTPSTQLQNTLFSTYGVNSIPMPLEGATATGVAWTVKEAATRFTRPAPIVPTVPNTQLDARGGVIVAPSL